MGVENEMWNLQAQANNTANSLAWMFSARADNLVNELAASYYSEVNQANMSNALQQSLVNALERGYNVSGITGALASIESAAKNAKKAMDDMNNVSSGGRNTGGGSDNSNTSKPAKDTSVKSPYTYGDYPDPKNNTNKSMKQYVILDSQTGKVLDTVYQDHNPTPAEIQAMCRRYRVPAVKVKAYANGTRNAKGGISITDEEGYEMKLPKLSNGQYTIANEGTQVLTKPQTDNMFKWSNVDPDILFPFGVLTVDQMQELWGMTKVPETVIDRKIVPSMNIHYDSLVTVNGDVNELKHLTDQMQKIADKSSDRAIQKLSEGIRR